MRDALTWRQPEPKDVGPCGGFSAQYASVCDYFQVTFREEVAWDVDTIYFSHDSHEMCLQDFDHLEHRDLVCIVSALEHNTWYLRTQFCSKRRNKEHNVFRPRNKELIEIGVKNTIFLSLKLNHNITKPQGRI